MKKKSLVTIVLAALFTLCAAAVAFAAAGGGEAASGVSDMVGLAIALGASFCIGIAAVGGGLSQGKVIAAALEGIARNPGAAGKVVTPMIIGLAMIESLVIYALVVCLILVGKL